MDFLSFGHSDGFVGKTVKLDADIDCKEKVFDRSVYSLVFRGTFNGQYHLIHNFTLRTYGYTSFAYTYYGRLKHSY